MTRSVAAWAWMGWLAASIGAALCAADVAGAADATPASYLALGDSYTIGEGVTEAERWPVQLARGLTAGGVPCAPPRIIARTGWTSDELLAAVDAAFPADFAAKAAPGTPAPRFDLVTLQIGVNDQYRGRPVEGFARAFPACLERAVGLASGRRERVVVVAIPDYGCTPFAAGMGAERLQGIHAGIDAFDAVLQRAVTAPTGFADILPLSRTLAAHRDWVVGDGLHPSSAQYAAWVSVILPVARVALGAGTAAATNGPASSATAAAP